MRVTVCFGQTRVIVPCKGGATVAELVREACARYKKAIGKSPKYWVKIKQLENALDGGILDVDDYVYDVAEDRDQLIAIFDEEDNQTYRYNGWDEASGSGSDSHRSPSSFQHHQSVNSRFSDDHSPANRGRGKAPTGNATVIKHDNRDPDLEVNVGVEALKSGSGSNITVLDPVTSRLKDVGRTHHSMKKTSGSPQHYYGRRLESGSGQEEDLHLADQENKQREIMITTANSSPDQNVSVVTASSDTNMSIDSGHHSIKVNKYPSENMTNSNSFMRGSTRQSIMGMLSENYEDERRYIGSRQPPDWGKIKSSHLNNYGGEYGEERYLPPPPKDATIYPRFYNDSQEMFVDIDNRPLGIKVTSYKENKAFLGLVVESVDKGGRSEREGLLQEGDIVVEINHYVLAQYTLSVAQEIFKDSMKSSELQLRVYPVQEREQADTSANTTVETHHAVNKHRHTPSIPVLSLVEATPPSSNRISAAKSLPDLNASLTEKLAQDASPSGKLPLAARMSLDTLANNTRKIGNMLEINLRKGEQGLGFSITTRDTPVGDPGPIYIKNILPKGAAIQDGRLHAGDRLLKVNDIEMTGHTQESAVNILRRIEVGSTVHLVVSRHLQTLPRKMKDDPAADRVLNDNSNKEHFKFEIALNDTGSAGLGISLKGNQSKKTKKDLGIFVKSVFHGGAAYQDGRLMPNDQLVSVNGQSLIGMTNHEAIDTLRTSMSTVGNVRGMIQMEIARRKNYSSGDPMSPQFSSEASSEISDSLVNERHSRTYEETRFDLERQTSTPIRMTSPFSPQRFTSSSRISHSRHLSDVSHDSSIFSTSLGGDAPLYEREEREIAGYIEKNLPRSSSSVLSPKNLRKKGAPRRHASLRTSNKEQFTFAETINRYTQSTSSPSSPQYKNIVGDLLWNAAIDNHYKPKKVPQKSGTGTRGVSTFDYPVNSATRNPPTRSHSLRGFRNKDNFAFAMSNPMYTMPKYTRGTSVSPTWKNIGWMKKSPFDNVTALEITGNSKEDYSEDSFHNNERQIDPNPMRGYSEEAYDRQNEHNNWTPSPDAEDPNSDPFSRESIFRQSISEKRKGAASRDAQSTDTFRALKNKPMGTEIVEKKPSLADSKQPTPSPTPLKWVKPINAKANHSSNSTSAAPTPKSPAQSSPSAVGRNFNNSSNLPARIEDKDALSSEVEVGPMLGIAKSSSLESLQTAVENYMEMQEGPFQKPQPRVLRGRVLNESFRAALDQSYDLENFSTKPMATLREEGSSQNGMSPLAKSSQGRTHEKKRAGKSYKIFGIFRVGKNKRSLSSDRNLDSQSSSSSSPRIPESEVHKKLLEAKREDDFKKHQEETERIQAKAKAMRERQQEQKKKNEEIHKSRENLARPEDRVRAPSVPVTAMQRMNIDPKVTYSEMSSGRRSVDPIAMRNNQPSTFEWQTAKRPTSPVNYGDRRRENRPERKANNNKPKANPDYSSLPRQPRLESNARTLPDNPDRTVANQGNHISTATSPNQVLHTRSRNSGPSGGSFSNQEFYNMQKPPGPKNSNPDAESRSRTYEREKKLGPAQRQYRSEKPKAGRTLYYDDTDGSPLSSVRSKTPQPRARRDVSPKVRDRPTSTHNGFGFPASGNSFHREDSPEPPPVMLRTSRHTTSTPVSANYRHSVHVDAPVSRKNEFYQRPRNSRPPGPKQSELSNFRWKTREQRNNHDLSDSGDSYRTASPASSNAAEQNRNVVKKILHHNQYVEKNSENIVISPPYNL